MDMDLEGLVILADDQAVTDAVEVLAQRLQVHIRVVLLDDIHRVVSVGDVLAVKDLKGALRRFRHLAGLAGGDHFAPEGGEHGAEDDKIALAAGVHNAGLFQHRVQVDGVLQRFLAGLDGADQGGLQAGAGSGSLGRGGGGQAGHGEDGALGRLHDGLVGRVDPVLHGAGKLHGAGGLNALEPAGDAPEQQGQNHAGVAAGAPQQGGGHAVSGGGHRFKLLLAQLHSGFVHGQAHVGAGVAVGHGEDVQVVDHLGIGGKGCISAKDHLLERGSIYIISQVKSTSGGDIPLRNYPIIVSIYTSTLLTGMPVDLESL